jgi:1,4-dihydroxy-2-naphthoate octaprenyltransferase
VAAQPPVPRSCDSKAVSSPLPLPVPRSCECKAVSSHLKTWLLAARPKTLWAGAVPVLMATAMAYAAGEHHLPAAGFALLGALLIQIGTNFANDYFDFLKGADTPDRVGPLRATQAGLVTPTQMRNATLLVFTLALLCGAYLIHRGGWPILFLGLVSIACGILYTGGPYPLAYLGLGDLFVFLFFGLAATSGTYYVQALHIPPNVWIAAIAPGLFSVAILTVNNLRDIQGDRRANKRTLPARFGPTFARYEYTLSLAIAILIIPAWLAIRTNNLYVLLPSLTCLFTYPTLRRVWREEGAALNQALAATGKLLLLYGILFTIGWLL